MTKTLLPALAALAAVALNVPPSAEAHSLYKPGWWKGKTLAEVAERQRDSLAHDRSAIRFFEERPDIRFVEARPHVRRLPADRIVKWHRTHLRMTKRELAQTLASIRAKRAAEAAAAAASEAYSSTSSSSATVSSASTSSAGGYASAATAACESGGNPSAVSADGRYRGKWQFDQQTWDAHAPSGWQGVDPASAPESVQDQAAGSVPYDAWPNC